jgi:AcrR family transcriptional regulator
MEQRILEAADRLFYRDGIRAVGVDTVAAEIGISKRTLYNHYLSKDDLIAAYLQRRITPFEITDAPPQEQIMQFFDQLERSFTGKGFRGCPFVNAVIELAEESHDANKLAAAFKEGRQKWFGELLNRMRVENVDLLATQLALLLDGAIVAALVRRDPRVARAARSAAQVLLNAASRARET